jgi:YHS domain-containing protein
MLSMTIFRRTILAALLLVPVAAPAQTAVPAEALDGVDPVILLQQGKEVFGKAALAVDRGRFRYLFSSPDTKATFEREPERYEIQLAGACARMGAPVTGNPSDYAIHDGRIYIFGSDNCRKRFVSAPEKFLPAPASPVPRDAQAAARGRQLLERAAAAIGGTASLDSVAAYAETISQVQRRGDADVTIDVRTIWRFPNEGRIERTMPMQGVATTFATVVTPTAMWNMGQGRVFPVGDFARPALEKTLLRHPLPLLKARNEPEFDAAATGTAVVDGTTVERVRVRYRGFDATLGIEPTSGRLHSLELQDRNRDSEVGVYTLVYTDFRSAGGLLLPHAARAFFNGQPDAFQTYTVRSIEVNPQIDPQLFAKPADPGR